MKKSIIVLLSLMNFLVLPNSAFATKFLTLKEFLKQELASGEEELKITKEKLKLEGDLLGQLKSKVTEINFVDYSFYYGKKDDELKKACTSVVEKGKEGPITLGGCFTPTGEVSKVSVMEFMEDHGKAVKEDNYLKQYIGKKGSDPIEVGKDIDAVSGATNSSKAISEAVRKASFVFNHLALKK